MACLMVKDTLLKALLMRYGFGATSDHSHDRLIGPFDHLVDVDCMVDRHFVNGKKFSYCFCLIVYATSF